MGNYNHYRLPGVRAVTKGYYGHFGYCGLLWVTIVAKVNWGTLGY